jgi:hypothetical protein
MIKVYGPYSRKTDLRKHIVLYDTETQKRTTVSYAKYLLEQKLGRKLETHETADHINEDKSNDNIDNLQVLTRVDNIRKSKKKVSIKKCWCGKNFQQKRIEQECCSRSCGQRYKA